MTSANVSAERWTKIGSSTTSPLDQTNRKTIVLDRPYVVVGFEVNNPQAYSNDTQDLAVDYGHAFFYLVKRKIITIAFSFGPNGAGKVGWLGKYSTGALIKDGMTNSRPGTPDYEITETVKAFQILLSAEQAARLTEETKKMREEIMRGSVRYSAFVNDTCAETAKEILDEAGIETPSGSGSIKHSKHLSFPIVYAVNPYKWHQNFKKQGHIEKTFKPTAIYAWTPPINEADPIFSNQAK
jgi:hypothetical protein